MTNPTPPAAPAPDDKDWTWVLTRECPECGLAVGDVGASQLADAVRAVVNLWPAALAGEHAATRPEPTRWSALEYGAHVVDVLRLAVTRTRLMLEADDPEFENWDQDEAALASGYHRYTIDDVLTPLLEASHAYRDQLASVSGADWQRPGRRSNGSQFTVLCFARYVLHDIAHHAWDVTGRRGSELGIISAGGGGAGEPASGAAGASEKSATGASEKGAEKGGERVRLNVPVRWFDLDAYGHVNNAEMFRLLEEARIKAFWTVPGQTARAAKNITIGGAGSETITLIAGHRIEYRTPLDYRPQGVEIDLWVTKLGGASAELAYEVFSDDEGPRVVYAVATSVMVFVSATTERPRKLTDAEREAWGELLGPAPKFRN